MPARRRDFILYIGDTFQRQINLRSGPEADIADFTGEFIVYNVDAATTKEAERVFVDDVFSVLHGQVSYCTDNSNTPRYKAVLTLNRDTAESFTLATARFCPTCDACNCEVSK